MAGPTQCPNGTPESDPPGRLLSVQLLRSLTKQTVVDKEYNQSKIKLKILNINISINAESVLLGTARSNTFGGPGLLAALNS